MCYDDLMYAIYLMISSLPIGSLGSAETFMDRTWGTAVWCIVLPVGKPSNLLAFKCRKAQQNCLLEFFNPLRHPLNCMIWIHTRLCLDVLYCANLCHMMHESHERPIQQHDLHLANNSTTNMHLLRSRLLNRRDNTLAMYRRWAYQTLGEQLS